MSASTTRPVRQPAVATPCTGAVRTGATDERTAIMKTRNTLTLLAIAAALAAPAWAAAAETQTAPPAAAAATTPAKPTLKAKRHHRRRVAHHVRVSALDRMHEHVALMRSVQQDHWIAIGERHHRLDATQAASLRSAVADVTRDQKRLARRGHETVAEALAVSHRQDVLDWAIRTDHPAFEPQMLHAVA